MSDDESQPEDGDGYGVAYFPPREGGTQQSTSGNDSKPTAETEPLLDGSTIRSPVNRFMNFAETTLYRIQSVVQRVVPSPRTDRIGPHVVEKTGDTITLHKGTKTYRNVTQWQCKFCGYQNTDRASSMWRSEDCGDFSWSESEKLAHKQREPDFE